VAGRLGDHPRSRAAARPSPSSDSGKGSFCATDLELMLRLRGIENIVLTGITTDVCVPHHHARKPTTAASNACWIEDCCAATDKGNPEHALKMIKDAGAYSARGRDLIGVIGALA